MAEEELVDTCLNDEKKPSTIEIANNRKHPHCQNARSQIIEKKDLLELSLLICEADIIFHKKP